MRERSDGNGIEKVCTDGKGGGRRRVEGKVVSISGHYEYLVAVRMYRIMCRELARACVHGYEHVCLLSIWSFFNPTKRHHEPTTH